MLLRYNPVVPYGYCNHTGMIMVGLLSCFYDGLISFFITVDNVMRNIINISILTGITSVTLMSHLTIFLYIYNLINDG